MAPICSQWGSEDDNQATWLNTVQRDLRAYNLTLNEAVDLAQNRPPWRLASMYVYTLPVANVRKEELAATLRGSRPGVQSASLIMTSLMTS